MGSDGSPRAQSPGLGQWPPAPPRETGEGERPKRESFHWARADGSVGGVRSATRSWPPKQAAGYPPLL